MGREDLMPPLILPPKLPKMNILTSNSIQDRFVPSVMFIDTSDNAWINVDDKWKGLAMKAILLIIILIFSIFLMSCISTKQYNMLLQKLENLEQQKKNSIMLLAEEAGASKFWWRNALQGNTSSSIDGITGASNGDAAMMVSLSGTVSTAYIYVYDSDGTSSDYPVGCTIECTRLQADGMGIGAWILADWYSKGIVTIADDGYRYFRAVNTTAFADTPTEGMCYWKDTVSNENDLCCYDADGSQWLCHSFD